MVLESSNLAGIATATIQAIQSASYPDGDIALTELTPDLLANLQKYIKQAKYEVDVCINSNDHNA